MADVPVGGKLTTVTNGSASNDGAAFGQIAAAVAALSAVYQPLDSDLTAIAALTTTSYGRAFLALADAAAGRTALGLGTAATQATSAFDAAGAATSAVSAHVAAVDPHADRAYTDAQIASLLSSAFDFKASVVAATTANITLSGAQTIDGVSVVAGNRVLVKNQSTGSQNGIYVAAAGAWARSTDADADAEVTAGMSVPVEQGTANSGRIFLLTTSGAIVVGTTALTFTRVDAGDLAAANNLSDLTSASSARSNLGLVIGTDVQAYHANLAALAGLAGLADRLPYFTGAGAMALATFTAAGRALVDDADAAAQRTTLGLGTAAVAASTDFDAAGAAAAKVDDTAYNATSWDGVTTVAPSKNAVRDKIEVLAPIASPTFTGNPAGPTPSAGDNDTSLATTAFVTAAMTLLGPARVGDYLNTVGQSNKGTHILQSNRMELSPIFIPRTCGIDRIAFRIQTTAGSSGSTVRLGLYASGSDGAPSGAALADVSVAGTATGVIEGTVALSNVAPGLYWAAMVGQSAPVTQPTIAHVGDNILGPFPQDIANSPGGCFTQASVSGALPSIGSLSIANQPPIVRVRVA